ncbi:MAG: hypothetical protein JW791_04395 [Nanoarchaeota archaeon]|nr:hypothetical protein [Nanoarchaeota archaeon]
MEKEEEDNEADDVNLAFANAEVVRLMKNNLPKDRMIKKRVKIAMNKFLEDICVDICKKLSKEPYVYIEFDMFKKAVQPFKDLKSLEVEKERLLANLNKIKAECDVMIDDVERKFSLFEDDKEDKEFY